MALWPHRPLSAVSTVGASSENSHPSTSASTPSRGSEAVVIWGNELVTLAISNGLEKIGFYVLGMDMVQVWLLAQGGTSFYSVSELPRPL